MSRELSIIKTNLEYGVKLVLLLTSFSVLSSSEISTGLNPAVNDEQAQAKTDLAALKKGQLSGAGFYHINEAAKVNNSPSQARFLYSSGDLLEKNGERWQAIGDLTVVGEGNAWLNRQHLIPATLADFPALRCSGTEPYWRLSLKDGLLTHDFVNWQSPYALTKVLESVNHNNQWWLKGERSSLPELNIMLKKSLQCSDDMSEQVFAYELSLSIDDSAYSGCCALQELAK